MSHTNSILNLLNIKDENITFGENWLTEEQIGVTFVKVFHGTLTYIPDACHNCGTIFDSNIIKYGFKISRIKLPSVSRFSSYLSLKKQRYLCKHCSSTFVLPTSLVRKNCFISNNTKLAIAIDIKEKVSEKDLALRHNVSHSTVSRIVDRSFYDYKPNFNHLPENLCFDEFKSVKSAAGAMSFIFCNADTHSIIDIVEDRRLHVLKKYFQNYKLETRNQVKRIVIDMYSPYMTLIKELFPKALIIIDKFHMVQLLSRAFNKTRIKIMNNDQKNYNKLKRYWRLLLKNSSEINHQDYFYRRCFKRRMTDFQVLEYLLSQNLEMKEAYDYYQTILHAVNYNNYKLFEKTIIEGQTSSEYIATACKTLFRYKDYAFNTLSCKYNNGVIEGINNKIKVIKRVAFGYKSFFHFKNRILITQGMLKIKTA